MTVGISLKRFVSGIAIAVVAGLGLGALNGCSVQFTNGFTFDYSGESAEKSEKATMIFCETVGGEGAKTLRVETPLVVPTKGCLSLRESVGCSQLNR